MSDTDTAEEVRPIKPKAEPEAGQKWKGADGWTRRVITVTKDAAGKITAVEWTRGHETSKKCSIATWNRWAITAKLERRL